MIKDPELLKKFEDGFIRGEGRLTYSQSLRIFESMWDEGRMLGALTPGDPLEGIDTDIGVARVLNSCLKVFSQG